MSSPDGDQVWSVVVAAGRGQRFGGAKQFAGLGGARVVDHAVATAIRATDGCVVVVPADAVGVDDDSWPGVRTVRGGATRADSVRAGLDAVPTDAAIVCVHDAARPLASGELFAAVVAAVRAGADGAIPGVPVPDTIKVVDAAPASARPAVVVATPDRDRLVAVQTPQAFAAAVLRAAHAGGADATDDAALVERAGGCVVVVPGEVANRKLTTAGDLEWAAAYVAANSVAAHDPSAPAGRR